MQVYGLVGQTSEGIYLSQSDQPVRKLAYCPKAHVLFVKYAIQKAERKIILPRLVESTILILNLNGKLRSNWDYHLKRAFVRSVPD